MKKLLFLSLLLLAAADVMAQKEAVMAAFEKHGIDKAILDPKIKQRPDDLAFDLKYTNIANDKQKVFVAKYDPSKPADEQWTVVSVNGKAPGDKEVKTFKKEHAKAPAADAKIDEGSYKVEKETADHLIVSYKLDAATLPEEASFLKDCVNHLTINLQTKRLEKLETLNEKPVKIKIVNADKVDVTIKYTYHEDMQRYLPDSEDMVLIVKLLGQSSVIETISEYSGYEKK